MPSLAELEEENERAGAQLSIEEKKALIREARRRYGSDWRKLFSNVKSGLDWDALKFKIQ